jgi:predicted PurR-regulated permease PerM
VNLQRVAINAAVVFATLTAVYLLWVFRQAVILFIFSLAITAAARPFVERLKARRVPRVLALLLVYLTFLGAVIAVVYAVGGYVVAELQVLADNLALAYDRIWLEWPEGTAFQQLIVQQLPAPARLYQSFSPAQQNTALQSLLGITLSSAAVIGQFGTVLILSIYWSIDRVHFERLWLSLLPAESRARARGIWRGIEKDFGLYVYSEISQSIFAGILLVIGLRLLGIEYPILLAVFGAIAWIIPWLGGLLAIAAVVLAGLSQGLIPAVTAGAYAFGVLIFLEFLIEPRFFNRRQYSSLLSILLIIALVEPFGLFGFIIAPPLAAAIELIFRYNLRARSTPFTSETVEQISQLRARVDHLRIMLDAREEPPQPQTVNMIQRLEKLVEQADHVLEREKTG